MRLARKTVLVDGVRLSVVDDGPADETERSGIAAATARPVASSPGAAPTVVCLHGNPTWSFLWRKVLLPLRAAGCRVVAPDLAGFGLSDKPTDPAYYTAQRHANNVAAVLRQLDVQGATLVLHDWGGPIGLMAAVAEPQRIARIVVANTVAFAPRGNRPLTKWHAFFANPRGQWLAVHANLVARSAFRYGVQRPLPRRERAAYLAPLRGRAGRGGRIAAARFVALVPDGPDHPSAPLLETLQRDLCRLAGKPLLVLWADADRVMRPRFAERWRGLAKETGLRLVDIRHVAPEAGHYWQEDAPEAFVPHILESARGD